MSKQREAQIGLNMKNKFGPWYAVQPENANGWWVVAKNPEGDETVDASGDGGFEEDVAKFIAASPDLLEALLGMMDAYMDLCDESEPNYRSFEFRQERWKAARAAIAKAKGEA